MRSPDEVAADHYRRRQRLVNASAAVAAQQWAQIDPAKVYDSWLAQVPGLTVAVSGAQLGAAAMADPYLAAILAAEETPADLGEERVDPRAFAGTASDGRPLSTLLMQPAFTTLIALGSGASGSVALAAGLATLEMLTRTQVADAGRVADGVALTRRRQMTGYVRMISGKTCSRCILLAGKFFRWNQGFQRHPRCDCIHVPTSRPADRQNPREIFGSMSRAEQDRVFGRAGAAAIRDGASVGQVVNARRGMYTAGGRTLTRESTGRSGVARGRTRLMPEEIYRIVGDDRGRAIRLLRINGYLR